MNTKKRLTILLKSGWQTVNIGDVAHTPGMLAVIERCLPEADVIWWPIACNDALEAMLRRRFPRLRIVPRELWTHEPVAADLIRPVFDQADLYLHGSGPNPMAVGQLRQWMDMTGKPFGVGGITVPSPTAHGLDILSSAAFFGCRETESLRLVQAQGIVADRAFFMPDAAFACDVLDGDWAARFMRQHGLRPRRFACFVGRLRYAPFHKMKQWYRPSAEWVERADRINAATAETDHARLRRVIVEWVRQTGLPAVICPEMIYQLDDMDALLIDPLPADVRQRVVAQRQWWLTDAASALYAQASAVVSMKMHSPVLAMAHGTPAIHIRQEEDTHKGQMWRDIGLADWLFEIDTVRGDEVVRTLLAIHADGDAARERLSGINQRLAALHSELADRIRAVGV